MVAQGGGEGKILSSATALVKMSVTGQNRAAGLWGMAAYAQCLRLLGHLNFWVLLELQGLKQ